MRRDNLRSEHHKVLPAAGLNPRFHVKVWSQSTHAIHQPLSSGDCIGFGRASTHCFAAALSGQPLGTGNDDSRICNKQVRWPLNHGSNGALFGIASSVSEPLTTKHRLWPFAFGFVSATHAVNARTAIIVDRHFRVDRFIAQPAPPPVSFPNFVKPTHLASSILRFGLFGPGHSGLRVNGSGAAASKCSLTGLCPAVAPGNECLSATIRFADDQQCRRRAGCLPRQFSHLSTLARPRRTARTRCPISTATGPRISSRPGSHALLVRTSRTWAASSTPSLSRIKPSLPTHTCRPPQRRARRYWRRNGEGMACSPSMHPRRVFLVGAEDEVPYWNGVLGETGADLAPLLLDQDGHGHHQGVAAGGSRVRAGRSRRPAAVAAANAGSCPSPR